MANVGIVIVSHSEKVAEGAADMVRQMVGDAVPLAFTGGNSDGGLGTDVGQIMEAIDRAWSEAGVAVLVDLGGAETNTEMAIEMIDESRQNRIA
ncbi:MAG: PTS-dependent dihydroxyacetone kinase phosphotransferase subunit DhaM, partial [Alphaproteobacteria bacterium]|nr:PTS-dependent dihydroxyacetone kinase phosphotransferase subunit DhaM [Alphaproteobacteria bacterium]